MSWFLGPNSGWERSHFFFLFFILNMAKLQTSWILLSGLRPPFCFRQKLGFLVQHFYMRLSVKILRTSLKDRLKEMCLPISSLPGRRHLRSAVRGDLAVPRYRLTTAGRRAFSFAGPLAWNSLQTYLNDHTLNLDSFKRFLKSFVSDVLITHRPTAQYRCLRNDNALYKCLLIIIIIIITVLCVSTLASCRWTKVILSSITTLICAYLRQWWADDLDDFARQMRQQPITA